MGKTVRTCADAVAGFLSDQKISPVFGIPGSSGLSLYESLDRSSVRTVLAAHEQGAVFMAMGYARARMRKPGVFAVVPGPGLTNAVTGMVEAAMDGVPVICLLVKKPGRPDRRFPFQSIDERLMLEPFLKGYVNIAEADDLLPRLREAFHLACFGRGGPVLVEIDPALLGAPGPSSDRGGPARAEESRQEEPNDEAVVKRLATAAKPVFYLGRGAEPAADDLRALAESLGIPVLTTSGARGILPENHPLFLGGDFVRNDVQIANDFLLECDLVLALGCRFSQTVTDGYRLKIPPDRLILIESELDPPDGRGPLRVRGGVSPWARRLLGEARLHRPVPAWDETELAAWRSRIRAPRSRRFLEPRIIGGRPPTAEAFFRSLRKGLPDSARLVVDSGLHQLLARRWFEARAPRSFLFPNEYQSMGFGIPAAIGAAMADPDETVVALVGDGGFAMTGMELGTAVREKVSLTVLVFNDRHLGLIRLGQLKRWGRSFATGTRPIDYAAFARALGASHIKLAAPPGEALQNLGKHGVYLIEVALRDGPDILRTQVKGRIRQLKRRG